MPNWNDVLKEINNCKRTDALDFVRRKYLKRLNSITGRNIIAYYSGFLQKPNTEQASIDDNDKNGFMAVIHKMDRAKGVDLILHTPGGNLAAAESLVEYLKQMFGNDVRAIVPQIAMSAGTMIACSCKSILMGKESSLGPIDPQFGGIPASGVIEEFERAISEIKADPGKIPIWQAIISKYHPSFIGECEKSIKWSREIVTRWLEGNMLENDPNRYEKARSIVDYLGNHSLTKSHQRHIGIDECERIGLKVVRIEDYLPESDFQDCVLTVHHAYIHTLGSSSAIKIIENQSGIAMVHNAAVPQQFIKMN